MYKIVSSILVFILIAIARPQKDSLDRKTERLFRKAYDIKIEQITLNRNLRKSIIAIDKDIAKLRDAHSGCLIMDEECSHQKHLEWIKDFKKNKGQ